MLLSLAVLGVLLSLVQSEQDGPRACGGCSPSLERVPTQLAGVAGDALQTGRRIGTAVLVGILRATVAAGHRDYAGVLGVALLCSVGFVLIALALGIVELRARQIRRSADQLQKVTMAAPSE